MDELRRAMRELGDAARRAAKMMRDFIGTYFPDNNESENPA
jgi:hypothetical protein